MEPTVILVVVGLHGLAAVVTALKGKPWFLLLGVVVGWFWVFGSLRLAKPHSWWARRFYSAEKLGLSELRFEGGGHGLVSSPTPPPAHNRVSY